MTNFSIMLYWCPWLFFAFFWIQQSWTPHLLIWCYKLKDLHVWRAWRLLFCEYMFISLGYELTFVILRNIFLYQELYYHGIICFSRGRALLEIYVIFWESLHNVYGRISNFINSIRNGGYWIMNLHIIPVKQYTSKKMPQPLLVSLQ